MKSRIWGVLVGVLISLSVVSAQSGGWVWQNNGSTLTTSTPNAASAVTIWNKNNSGCTLTLKTASAGTVALSVCGTTITVPTGTALTGLDSITFSGGQSLVGSTANTTELRNGTSAQVFNIYNTYAGAGAKEWFEANFASTPNVMRFITNASGGGSIRNIAMGAGGGYWIFDGATAGLFRPSSDNAYDFGDATHAVKAGYFRATISVATTYANRPAIPVEGMIVNFTDGDTDVWGATVAGGGALHVQARYNGTNWTVVGK